MLKVANLAASASASAERLGTAPGDRWLLAMPLVHVGGLSILVRACRDGSSVVLSGGSDPQQILDALEREQVTLASLVPTMLQRVLAHLGEREFPRGVRLVLLGGAAASGRLVGEALRKSVPLALTYGLTEACSQVATALPAAVALKPGSVGKALPGTSLRIARIEADPPGGTAAPGEVGEILVQGPTVMRGYLRGALLDGWLHTGDLGYLDLDGDLYVVQRRTDLIVSGGENVYPAEVENALRSHPDVKEACVVGLPDEIWGQRVAALVVQRRPGGPDAEKLVEYLRGRLAGYKIPRTIAFTDELPCTASGKVCRPDVLEILQSEVDAAEINREGTRYG